MAAKVPKPLLMPRVWRHTEEGELPEKEREVGAVGVPSRCSGIPREECPVPG